jgi:hypothetical protein
MEFAQATRVLEFDACCSRQWAEEGKEYSQIADFDGDVGRVAAVRPALARLVVSWARGAGSGNCGDDAGDGEGGGEESGEHCGYRTRCVNMCVAVVRTVVGARCVEMGEVAGGCVG